MSSIGAAGPLIGVGCMRLSTGRDRDEARAVAVLHAAFDAGATLLDTADAYCWDDSEMGHKGGLTRPQGNWRADGRARYLVAACQACAP
jgi:aryl-alcohol dehydrogenase-like predicted oxidoreductase